jgi:hypothetical protein
MFASKISVHPCVHMFPSNGNIYKYMPCAFTHTYSISSVATILAKTKQNKEKMICHDLWSDLCIYLLSVSCIKSEATNIWNVLSYYSCTLFNLLAMNLDTYILVRPLCEISIFYESKKITWQNTQHFVQEKTAIVQQSQKFSKHICWLYKILLLKGCSMPILHIACLMATA